MSADIGEVPRRVSVTAIHSTAYGERRRWRITTEKPHKTIAKADAMQMLRRARFPEETIRALAARLDDPIDVERDGTVLARYGVTLDELIDRMGGSP